MFFILQKIRLGYCRVSLEMTSPYAAASGLFWSRSFCCLSPNHGSPCKCGTRSSWTQKHVGFRTGRKMVCSVSVSAQLAGEVCAIASSGSGQKGVPRSMEPSWVRCSTMCRNGSKQQYLTCALKPSLLKTVLVLSKWTCCSVMIAWSARHVRCLWRVDHAECQPDFCIQMPCVVGCCGSQSSLLGTLELWSSGVIWGTLIMITATDCQFM